MPSSCPFCNLAPERVLKANDLVQVIRDAYPVSPGHTLIIPRRHIGSYFDATERERAAMWNEVAAAKEQLDASHAAEGYNIGINDGLIAGQTIPHLHVHLIPRYNGDTEEIRGGVRWVIPNKAKYW